MSSFPQHVKNIESLNEIGFDVSEAYEAGSVTYESWGYDDLTYLISEIIEEMKAQGFKALNGGSNDQDNHK